MVKGKASAATSTKEMFKEASKQLSPDEVQQPGAEKPAQGTLPGTPAPETPKPVRNGRMLANFVRPYFENDDGDRKIGFELSLPLGKEHDGLLPPEVMEEWKIIKRGNVKRIEIEDVAPQTITISLVPEPDKDELDVTCVAMLIRKPVLTMVQEKGAGKTKRVVRYSFRAVTDLLPRNKGKNVKDDKITDFVLGSFGDQVWFSTQRTQKRLLD